MAWRKRPGEAPILETVMEHGGSYPSRYADSIDIAAVEDAVSVAMEKAIAELPDDVRLIGVLNVNVNIQLASGGGATNVVGNVQGRP